MNSVVTPRPKRPSAARSRILAAANKLFYSKGIRAVGVDRLVTESQVTRATFYRHFASKDELIAAYLAGRLEHDRAQLAGLRASCPDDPRATLRAMADVVTAQTSSPDFRGCPYLNFTAEYCEGTHPARSVAVEHRNWLRGVVEDLLVELNHPRAATVAEQLVMLRAGAMAVGAVGDAEAAAAAFNEVWDWLIDPIP